MKQVDHRALFARIAAGLPKQLLDTGLLSGQRVTQGQLRATAVRVLADCVDALAESAAKK